MGAGRTGDSRLVWSRRPAPIALARVAVEAAQVRCEAGLISTTHHGPPHAAGSYGRRGPGYGRLDGGDRLALQEISSERPGKFAVMILFSGCSTLGWGFDGSMMTRHDGAP